jgi:hypothetical protein
MVVKEPALLRSLAEASPWRVRDRRVRWRLGLVAGHPPAHTGTSEASAA